MAGEREAVTLWTRIFMVLVVILLTVIAVEGWLLLRWISNLGAGTGWTIYPPMGG